ncbi:MAG: hypothetical protein KBC45_08805 [Pseudomonas sp.]|uniref:hypothetical protein n=1 Tax=Pseudomonas sp. TaxID=306 RepID=UPI001B5A09EA|nr:hypothetical protein [Pseudomonas sp.]MBP6954508.1 hypothetical protein [Pseudomonas sp.]
MNNIPKGFKLVPVEPTDEMIMAFITKKAIGFSDEYPSVRFGGNYRDMLAAAPTPPQLIYDEAKERELFEVHYRDLFENETGRSLSDDDIKSLRDGLLYGKSRTYLNGQWVGWQACAQSRVKAGEDE